MDLQLISVRIPSELKIQLEKIAKEESRSLNNLINIILRNYVRDYEKK